MIYWYFKSKYKDCPLASEYSYDYNTLKNKDDNLEEFTGSVLVAYNAIFRSMNNMDALIKTRGTTKTMLAYEGV